MTVGFRSARRFNQKFQARFGLSPGAFRKDGRAETIDDSALVAYLTYRPPYAWSEVISYLQHRAIPGVESVTLENYSRTVTIRNGGELHHGWISVAHAPKRHALRAVISCTLLPVFHQVTARIKHLFDLHRDPVAAHKKLIEQYGLPPDLPVHGIRVPGCFDPFEVATATALGQQSSASCAGPQVARLATCFGGAIVTPFEELSCVFPLPDSVADLQSWEPLVSIGIPAARARTIHALAQAMRTGSITLVPEADCGKEMDRLQSLPGFSPWMVQYVALRALGWGNVALETDAEVRKALTAVPLEPRERRSCAPRTHTLRWRGGE